MLIPNTETDPRLTLPCIAWWANDRVSDLPSRGCGFQGLNTGRFTIKWLLLKWVTVCGQVNHLHVGV